MDKILDLLLSLDTKADSLSGDAYERHLTSIILALNKTGANQMVSVPGGVDYLDVLHPWTHSVGYLYVLLANIRIKSIDTGVLWRRTVTFLEGYDPRQISYVQDQFKALVEEAGRYVSELGKPILLIWPLKQAIQRSTKPATFTSLHTLYILKCIEAKCYRDAAAILDVDLTEIPSKKESKEICYQDLLEYFLYGGMVYIALKNWRRALDFLTYAVAYPTGATCSAIQVEAYKKYSLVGLLLKGKPVYTPSGASTVPSRTYRVLAKPYDSFVAAFKTGDPEALRKQAAYSMPIFTEDGNAGLATQCMDAFRRFKIARLTHTYVTLSVQEISRRNLEVIRRGSSQEETEQCILGMIERDEIRASLSHESPSMPNAGCILHFHNNPQSEKQNLKALEEQIARTVSITKQAQAMGANLGLSKEFLQHLNRTTKSGDRGGHGVGSMNDLDSMDTGDAADHMYQGNTSFAFDEDLMHDHDSLDEDS